MSDCFRFIARAANWLIDWVTLNQTHYRSYRGRVFTGQMTQPTVSKHWRNRQERQRPSGCYQCCEDKHLPESAEWVGVYVFLYRSASVVGVDGLTKEWADGRSLYNEFAVNDTLCLEKETKWFCNSFRIRGRFWWHLVIIFWINLPQIIRTFTTLPE